MILTYIYHTITLLINVIRTDNTAKGTGTKNPKGTQETGRIEYKNLSTIQATGTRVNGRRICIQTCQIIWMAMRTGTKGFASFYKTGKTSKQEVIELLLLSSLLFLIMYTWIYYTKGFAFQRYEYR